MKFTNRGIEFIKSMVAMHEGAEALLLDTEEVEGGLSLSMHITDLKEGDRVLDFDGLKVIVSEELEMMLGPVIFDEVNGELAISEEPSSCGGGCGSCGGGCGGHDDGEDCGCDHDHEHGDCGCGNDCGCKN